jgi:hypothetical protein
MSYIFILGGEGMFVENLAALNWIKEEYANSWGHAVVQ